jgi:hypothetical protein
MASEDVNAPIDDISLGHDIGLAFFFWQGVEQQATEVFRLLLAPAHGRSIETTFHALKGFSVRLDLLNEIATAQLCQTELAEDWVLIYHGFRKALSNRHDLTHLAYKLNFAQRSDQPLFRGPLFDRQTDPQDRLKMSDTEKTKTNEKLSQSMSHFSALVAEVEAFKLKLVSLKGQQYPRN